MAVLRGNSADVYIAASPGSAFTDEACSLVAGTTYQITSTTKRRWDPTTAVVVKDGGSAVDIGLYSLNYSSGKVVFRSAPGGAVTVSGAYLSATQLGQSSEWEASVAPEFIDTTVFGAERQRTPSMLGATVRLKRFFADGYFYTNKGAYFALELYVVASGAKWTAIGLMDSHAVSTPAGGMVGEDVSFQCYGPMDYQTT